MTKEAYAIYMTIKKSTFYITGHNITLRSDHLPLNKFLKQMTLNNTVNNWAMEIESFKINFVHIAGKDNLLADMLSRLIDIDLMFNCSLNSRIMNLDVMPLKHYQREEVRPYMRFSHCWMVLKCVKLTSHTTTQRTHPIWSNFPCLMKNFLVYRTNTLISALVY